MSSLFRQVVRDAAYSRRLLTAVRRACLRGQVGCGGHWAAARILSCTRHWQRQRTSMKYEGSNRNIVTVGQDYRYSRFPVLSVRFPASVFCRVRITLVKPQPLHTYTCTHIHIHSLLPSHSTNTHIHPLSLSHRHAQRTSTSAQARGTDMKWPCGLTMRSWRLYNCTQALWRVRHSNGGGGGGAAKMCRCVLTTCVRDNVLIIMHIDTAPDSAGAPRCGGPGRPPCPAPPVLVSCTDAVSSRASHTSNHGVKGTSVRFIITIRRHSYTHTRMTHGTAGLDLDQKGRDFL